MAYSSAHCEPLAHEWEVEEVSGSNGDDDILLKFRCRKCNATLKGVVVR